MYKLQIVNVRKVVYEKTQWTKQMLDKLCISILKLYENIKFIYKTYAYTFYISTSSISCVYIRITTVYLVLVVLVAICTVIIAQADKNREN